METNVIPPLIEKYIDFEDHLFGSNPVIKYYEQIDHSYLFLALSFANTVRPFVMEDTIDFILRLPFDKQEVLHHLDICVKMCPALVFFLYKKGYLCLDEIVEKSIRLNSPRLKLYFYGTFPDVIQSLYLKNSTISILFKNYPLMNDEEMEFVFSHGFPKSSIEFLIKYDLIADLQNNCLIPDNLCWNPFEWTIKTEMTSPLNFAAHFGSIKCFKYLLMSGLKILPNIEKCVVFGGNYDIFHIAINNGIKFNSSVNFVLFAQYELMQFINSRSHDKNNAIFLLTRFYLEGFESSPHKEIFVEQSIKSNRIVMFEYFSNKGFDINWKNSCHLLIIVFKFLFWGYFSSYSSYIR